ncbi:hypothetical protein UREG_04802 [Uncinocarpus reesii 1704]|uniref:Phosphoribosyltransferase domain-containing protein n=1 Tax=Uncinocarpus reesii (strain UAMH 1704) TaxID=336963 RepID=C4JUJ9_UNCRE|nr:uncharacterized protein UREG_04802 [Uncinocarpus reesii 1704]EEP79960.1 hypothetical protein UREG_04802 [Uncinocarpus reesii 1704]
MLQGKQTPTILLSFSSFQLTDLLPNPVPVHHLGLFREPTTLQPVEYYNNLPFHRSTSSNPDANGTAADLAILLDPIVATGGTAAAAIQSLKEWGVKKVILLSILGTRTGLTKAASEWPEGVEVLVGDVDDEIDAKELRRTYPRHYDPDDTTEFLQLSATSRQENTLIR